MVSPASTFEKATTQLRSTVRIQSIDFLRGLVMIIMALDHVRDYFHADAFLYNPLDLQKTSVALFFTRWITHFCAPVFVFLAGTSAFMVGVRKGPKELSSFLLKRGLWLILMEVTVMNFAWFFNIQFSLIVLQVIWVLGIGMILLGAAVRLPFKMIFALGIVLVAGHNLLDGIHVEDNNAAAIGWSLLHEFRGFQLGAFFLYIGYPILPWTGIMLLGYCFGKLYQNDVDAAQRKKILLRLGLGMLLLFAALRSFNIYGDPAPWSVQASPLYSFLSFINVSKYPPSLLYVLITIGPAMLLLAISEKLTGKLSQYVVALGRVPLFYYIIHVYLIHIVATMAALAMGYPLDAMVFNTWITDSPALKGYGFSLGITYVIWIAIVLALYPLCLWYDRYKLSHAKEKWWLSYL
jgi:uncharacterized membrane protein